MPSPLDTPTDMEAMLTGSSNLWTTHPTFSKMAPIAKLAHAAGIEFMNVSYRDSRKTLGCAARIADGRIHVQNSEWTSVSFPIDETPERVVASILKVLKPDNTPA